MIYLDVFVTERLRLNHLVLFMMMQVTRRPAVFVTNMQKKLHFFFNSNNAIRFHCQYEIFVVHHWHGVNFVLEPVCLNQHFRLCKHLVKQSLHVIISFSASLNFQLPICTEQ